MRGLWSPLWSNDCLSWSDTTLELTGSWPEMKEDWEVCSPFSRQIITSDKKMTWEDAKYYYYYIVSLV